MRYETALQVNLYGHTRWIVTDTKTGSPVKVFTEGYEAAKQHADELNTISTGKTEILPTSLDTRLRTV